MKRSNFIQSVFKYLNTYVQFFHKIYKKSCKDNEVSKV